MITVKNLTFNMAEIVIRADELAEGLEKMTLTLEQKCEMSKSMITVSELFERLAWTIVFVNYKDAVARRPLKTPPTLNGGFINE